MRRVSFKIASLCVRSDELWILDELKKIAGRERVSVSHVIREAVKEYVKTHKDGNPQKPLFPNMEPWEIPMVEKRYEKMEWLESVIRRNPGVPVQRAIAIFSRVSGLRRETVVEYLKTLEAARVVKEIGGKLYTVDTLPSQ